MSCQAQACLQAFLFSPCHWPLRLVPVLFSVLLRLLFFAFDRYASVHVDRAVSVNCRCEVDIFSEQGRRPKMEDRHLAVVDLNAMLGCQALPPQSFFAVYDGHGGVDAAAYAQAQLHLKVSQQPSFASDVRLWHTVLTWPVRLFINTKKLLSFSFTPSNGFLRSDIFFVLFISLVVACQCCFFASLGFAARFLTISPSSLPCHAHICFPLLPTGLRSYCLMGVACHSVVGGFPGGRCSVLAEI